MRYHPFSHFGLKIVSLVLAILFWIMVAAQRSSVERGLRIPLELQNLPENLEMVDPPQEAVDVRVRGDADALGRLVPGDLVASIDLSSAQPGRRLFHISPERVKVPFAVEVTQVTPSSVAIRFEPSATRVVPVQPSVVRDISLVVPSGVTAAAIESVLRREGGKLLERLDVLDEYRGKGLPDGTRGVTWRCTFRDPAKTLTEGAIDAPLSRMLKALEEQFDVRRRQANS